MLLTKMGKRRRKVGGKRYSNREFCYGHVKLELPS